MSENSQSTLIDSSQEDILSSKLESTKIEDPETPLDKKVGSLELRTFVWFVLIIGTLLSWSES